MIDDYSKVSLTKQKNLRVLMCETVLRLKLNSSDELFELYCSY